MKKILFILTILLPALSMRGELKYGSYYNSHFDRNFEIKTFVENDTIKSVNIGVLSADGKDAFITVKGKDLAHFIQCMEHVRDRFLEGVKRAKENHTDSIHYFCNYFPNVDVMWVGTGLYLGTAFNQRMVMKALTLDDGKMVMSWTPKLEDSENPYNEEQIYFVFGDNEDDFNDLISEIKQ